MPITLQKTFSYANGATSPVSSVTINVAFPQYSFDGNALSVTGQGAINFPQELASTAYAVGIPLSSIFGPDYASTLSKHFISLRDHDQGFKIKLRDVSSTFSFSYGGDAASKVDKEALYFLKILTPDGDRAAATTTATATTEAEPRQTLATHAVRDIGALLEANVYVVNKMAYLEVLHSMFTSLADGNESILLYLISLFVDLSGPTPVLASQATEDGAVQNIFTKFGMDLASASAIRAAIASNFAKLFDFPLQMPEVKLLKIAGSVRVVANEVQFSNFTLCNLNVDLTAGGAAHTLRWDWKQQDFHGDRIEFAFPEQYVQSNVQGKVAVRVTAYDNSSLYFADFEPSDPTLQHLSITITPKIPSSVQPPPVIPTKPTKLRGQIVSMSSKPAETLQGAVVIQARTTETSDWVPVSSTMSDRTGNFSMPYPSGKFYSARAITSLDLKSTASISVNDGALATNFIYILLQAPPEDATKKDDCKCEQKPEPTARLPSQEDLVHSDQFTQDVGGTCLNLNTPNRTLKEYNYQALVRTSDPDVANYSLRSVTDKDTGSRTFLMANHGKIQRDLVDLDNPIRWQDDEDDSQVQITPRFPTGFNSPFNISPAFGGIGGFRRKPEINVSVYQAVTVATGHILHYKSEFKADGYSLGDLLYSVPLAPGQKKQIVIFDASHSFSGSEDQNISQAESLASNLLSERSIVDQIAGNIGENLRGQSDATTAGISAAAGASGTSGFIGASAGVAGGYSNANSNASQDSNRNLSQYFQEQLRQSINQNASSYRKLTASAVTTVKEGQQYNAETSVIANHNHCHSLTMMYFEVLRHFAVFQELVDVEECVFVPLLMTKFSNQNVAKWADILVTKLLPIHSNTYLTPYTHPNSRLQHPLVPAFDAIERIRTNYGMVDYPKGAYDEESIRQVDGTATIHVDIPRPKSKYDFIMSLPIVTKTVSHQEMDVGDGVKTVAAAVFAPWSLFSGPQTHTVTEDVQVKKNIFDGFMTLDANYENVPPAQCIRINSFASFNLNSILSGTLDPIQLLSMSPQDEEMWRVYAYCVGYDHSNLGVLQMMNVYFKGQLLSEWDTIFKSEIAPKVFEKMVASITIDVLPFQQMTVDSRYNGGERDMTITFSGQPSAANRAAIQRISVSFGNETIKSIRENTIFNLRSLRISYSTNHYRGLLYSGNLNADLLNIDLANPTGPAVTRDTPESSDEKRNPRKEDIFIANRLIDHLNFNLEYYNRVLWYSLDPDRRWLLLDGFKIQIFDEKGQPEQPESYRSLASVIKNNLIAVTGNSLVFPVAPGFRVNRSLIVASNDDMQNESPSLLDQYKPLVPAPPYRLSVPTRGVYMEAVMGSCDSCEKVKPDSSQDWTKFTTDEPTAIAQVQPPVPAVTDYKAAFQQLANPLVAIQNAPGAPDPGVGLAASTDLLAKSGLFKDITGLEGNQANAIKTYLSNNDNVRAMASMASGLAMQAHNTENSARFMETANAAHDKGILSDKEYGDLVKAHLQQQVDGGASAKAQADGQKASLEDAAVQAIQQGKDVQASTSDGGGATKSINVKSLLATAVPGSDAGAGGGGGGGTVSDKFEVGNGSTLVKNFKGVFENDNDTILQNGQFNISTAVENAIIDVVEPKAGSDAGLQAVWATMKDSDGKVVFEKLLAQNKAIKDYIYNNHLGSQFTDIANLFKPHNGDPIQKIFGDFWVKPIIRPAPKIVKPTFDLLQQAYDWEKAKCGYVAQMLGNKYVNKRNAPLPGTLLFDQEGILKAQISPSNLPVNSTDPQVFTYDAAQLKKIMDKVKESLLKDRPVVVGVMSGTNHTDNGVAFSLDPRTIAPEHYILIFKQDGPDKFFFWDPDVRSSDIKQPGAWGQGFGVLFYRKDRIGTAFSDADLTSIETQGKAEGNHKLDPKGRHRYQAYYLRNSLSFPRDKVIEKLKYDPDTGKAVP
ncbi:hypothetical protein QQS21_008742 [Conoideocrella luteorostrata]|uniref:Uncharacterized protein n=1 Tax=Conoideocrella luteorostrata TaxID=1105319 RepID=A0AAJ0CJ69_9HYPO|nr:hypothetical protein QQS21_008742 [Conoideocrella luteorostrata]